MKEGIDMLGIIRVLTTDNSSILESHGKIISSLYGIKTQNCCIPNQPHGVHDDSTELAAIPKIVDLAKKMEANGAKAILISCAADPALRQTREALHIPVLGAGTCGALVSMALGSRVGVLNLTGQTPISPAMILGSRQTMEIAPEEVDNTLDLMTPNGMEAAKYALQKLEDHCDVVMLACTGFATIGFAEKMRPLTRIPIVDAVEASGAIAQIALRSLG